MLTLVWILLPTPQCADSLIYLYYWKTFLPKSPRSSDFSLLNNITVNAEILGMNLATFSCTLVNMSNTFLLFFKENYSKNKQIKLWVGSIFLVCYQQHDYDIISKIILKGFTVDPLTTWVWTAWVHLYVVFFFFSNKHSAYFFFLKIFQLTKCGEIFVFNWRSEIVESKELGYEFWFCPNCFSFLPLCESFISSFVSEAEIAVSEFFHCDVEGGRESYS